MAETKFTNRYLIEGTLTTTAPLHIGSGEFTTRNGFKNEKDGNLVEIGAVVIDHEGRSYIPGTTIKGNLRAWLRQRGADTELIEEIFGSEKKNRKEHLGGDTSTKTTTPGYCEKKHREKHLGGKVEFWDAYTQKEQDIGENLPFLWHEKRLTGVSAHCVIDRHTRATRKEKLFHHEFVPAGVKYEVKVAGQDLSGKEADCLLGALYGFQFDEPVTLGASTVNGWGRFTWKLTGLKKIDAEGVKKWMKNKEKEESGYGALEPLPQPERVELEKAAEVKYKDCAAPRLTLDVSLEFDGLFMVNAPRASKKAEKGTPDHQPFRNHEGKIILPAGSIRGVLRSQAERIIRTLGGKACHIADPKDACKELQDKDKKNGLCLACQAFGTTGWQTPVHLTDFKQVNTEHKMTQEFVAIDRFTGGGADERKFNADAAVKPRLTGTIGVDLKRAEPWALGLLALVLRDLIQGDMAFGARAAKDYGQCKATVVKWKLRPQKAHSYLLKLITCAGLPLEGDVNGWDDVKRNILLNTLVTEFRKKIIVEKGAGGKL